MHGKDFPFGIFPHFLFSVSKWMDVLEKRRNTSNLMKALLISGKDAEFMSLVLVGVELYNY